MSKQFPGGIISKTAPVPSGSYQNSAASGVWTLEQQAYWQKLGQWPTAGNTQNFIEDVFSTYLYTGTNPPTATQTIVNGIDLAGKGGLVWIKPRNAAEAHILSNTATGVNNFLQSQSSSENSVGTNWLTAFNSNGFTVGNNINGAIWNLVSWTFRKQAKFFDIVTYTGNGTAGRTIAHNLGSVPGCIIVKQLAGGSTGGVNNWFVYHRSLGGTKYLGLDSTIAAVTSSSPWNNTDPTSTVFTIGGTSDCNDSGGTYIAYLFAHNAGGFGLTGTDNVISCGSYTGDGSNGQSVSLGYEPQWLLIKRTDTTANWMLQDNMRPFSVTATEWLNPNTTNAESTGGVAYVSPTATGFTFTSGGAAAYNASGGTYIYIAIRRGPMAVPTLGTSVFSPVTRAGNDVNPTVVTTPNFAVDMQISTDRGKVASAWNWAVDKLRGTSVYLPTNRTDSEYSDTDAVIAFTNTGFNLGASGKVNASGGNYIYWNFRRAPNFFDEVCYTGNGSTQTISHNLGVMPELIIAKNRGQAGNNWPVLFNFASTTMNYGFLNLTNSCPNDTYANVGVFSALPTATSMFLVNSSSMNASGYGIVAYLFATCPGVSKVGSYTGTGAAQTVNCGFTTGARFVLIKRTDSTGDWYVWDSARGIIPANDPYLLLNSTAAEVTGTDYVDTTSVGFDITSTAPSAINANGGTFIFLAIA